MKRLTFILPIIIIIISIVIVSITRSNALKAKSENVATTTVIVTTETSTTTTMTTTTTTTVSTTTRPIFSEYHNAHIIWNYFNSLGWSDTVKAGIMGNIMAEVGGHSLIIEPLLYGFGGTDYYGICQWSAVYYPEVQGASLENQLNFLANTIESVFNDYGFLYMNGFNFEQFLSLDNEQDAALAFAMIYERCHSNYYSIRLVNATIAYEYFCA